MALSTLPLSYCTNVHPALTLDGVINGLRTSTSPVQEHVGHPVSAGLWLAAPVIAELNASPIACAQLADALHAENLCCYTLNAFPYGNFHDDHVKETVYRPDWTAPERLDYTHDCARVLSRILPDGTEGSISTVPLGFKGFARPDPFLDDCTGNLLELVRRLNDLHDETGRLIRLAIEPEPLCVLETTPETIAFFTRLRERAADAGLLDETFRHIGVCYDVCHQSVEFEDVAESIAALHAAEVRINKVHITCAIRVENPSSPAQREALGHYVEPRYLHQTFAQGVDGTIRHVTDLSAELCADPPDEFSSSREWRVHFHVPVNAESLGPLSTTRDDLRRALAAVAELEYAPHLEVETYTWGVLPGDEKPDLVEGLAAEMIATDELLKGLS